MLQLNTILQNRYRVVRLLGKGGMGAVYEAIDQCVNCLVALKQTIVNATEHLQAFQREASLLANLRHAALPKVSDFFSEGGNYYLVMEHITGDDLYTLLEKRKRPFDVKDVVRWGDELLKALEYLHGQSPPILHRDIKPPNLKLTKQNEIVLLDFGLAKGIAGQMATIMDASKSVHAYTLCYAPLEQIHGHGTDARSDLYSAAATLYHLMTNETPESAPKRFEEIDEHQSDLLSPPH
jgi:serine/threonine protein kinase